MKFRWIAVMALALALANSQHAAPAALAQTTAANGDWSVVETLPSGVAVTVETMDGDTLKGRVSGATDATLTFQHKGKPVVLNRSNIRRVYQREGKSRARGALFGAAVGGVAGVGAGLVAYLPARDDIVGAIVPTFGLLGAAIGAGVGAAFGRGGGKTLIYQAK